MPPIISIPRYFKGVTLSKLADEISSKCPAGLPPVLVFDFEQLRFIRPAGVFFSAM
jgi:hypothetical protein